MILFLILSIISGTSIKAEIPPESLVYTLDSVTLSTLEINEVDIIDAKTSQHLKSLRLNFDKERHPHGFTSGYLGRFVYLANMEQNHLYRINTYTDAIDTLFIESPESISILDTNECLVVKKNSNQVIVVDLNSFKISRRIDGGEPI